MAKKITKADWVWMPHPAHYCVAYRCRYHLATCIGGYIISTVGEKAPIDCKEEYPSWEPISSGGILYETMVFKARKSKEICCPYEVAKHRELDCFRSMDRGDAYKGHLALCYKYMKLANKKLAIR